MKSVTLYRFLCGVAIALIVALGLGTKFYSDWDPAWVSDFLGDALYEMAWIWLIGAIWVRWRAERIAIAVFLTTALIECSQLIPFPAAWKAQLWWRLLLGTHFSWMDFVYYAVGCLLGAVSLIWLKTRLGLAYKA